MAPMVILYLSVLLILCQIYHYDHHCPTKVAVVGDAVRALLSHLEAVYHLVRVAPRAEGEVVPVKLAGHCTGLSGRRLDV